MSLFNELKRRNVFRVGIAYIASAWLILQVVDLVADAVSAPAGVMKIFLMITAVGFPLALLFAWAFEVTPDGVKLESEVDRSQPTTKRTGRKLDFVIIAILFTAVSFLLVDKFVLTNTATNVEVTSTGSQVTSVAVLPFVAMSDGADDEFFADGLTEELLNSLAHLPELLVTARTSAFAFKGQDLPIPEVAEQLGVAHVVEGSVRRSGNQLRITAQLIRAADGFHLWSDTYDRSDADSFGVQTEIAEKVAAALNIVLSDEQLERMRSTGLRNPEAFIAYQKGSALYGQAHAVNTSRQAGLLLEANRYFERTLELEPGFSAAYFRHGDYFVHAVTYAATGENVAGFDANGALEQAISDFDNAARLATNDGQRLNAAMEAALITGEWQRLPSLIDAAAASTDCISSGWWSLIPRFSADGDRALRMARHELACDPLSFYARANLVATQIVQGDIQSAITSAEEGMGLTPHRRIASLLISAHLAAGQPDEAQEASQRYVEQRQRRQKFDFQIAAILGDADDARLQFENYIEEFGTESLIISDYAILGDRETANRVAAEWDARPLGVLSLLTSVDGCFCGAPFDLANTPNFARLIEETEFQWPPPGDFEWPLKDW